MARAHQPHVGHRGARSGNELAVDDGAARHDGHQLQAARIPHRRLDAGTTAALARGHVLRVRRDRRRRASRLSRPGVRMVRDPRSVHVREARRARSRSRVEAEPLRVLPDHQHALSVHPDAAVSTGVVTDVRRASVRRGSDRPPGCAHRT